MRSAPIRKFAWLPQRVAWAAWSLPLLCLPEAGAAGTEPGTLEPRVHVVVPLPPAPPPPVAGARSSATFRVAAECPPGTWRWREPQEAHGVSFEVASQLVVLVETVNEAPVGAPVPGPGETPPAPPTATAPAARAADETLAAAGAGIASALRLRVPALESGSTPPEAASILAAWESDLEEVSASAARSLASVASTAGAKRLRLRALVVRERIDARCAAVEMCVDGRWQPAGHRAEGEHREPLAPFVFESEIIECADPAAAAGVCEATTAALADWLRKHYGAAAARNAVFTLARDPCEVAKPVPLPTTDTD